MTINPVPKAAGSCCTTAGGSRQISLALPVAPRAFSRIRFDQVDLPARAVPPAGAMTWLAENIHQGAAISSVDLAGPGDPLAEIELTMETLALLRRDYPELALTITTLGLHGDKYAKALAAAGVTAVTLLVDAVAPQVAEKIYAWIRPDRKTVVLAQAATLLIDEQSRGIKAFRAVGCEVEIRTTVYPGFNDDHIAEIARVMAGLGAGAMTLQPCKTMADPEEQMVMPPDSATMRDLRDKAARHLATALPAAKESLPGLDCPSQYGSCRSMATSPPKPTRARPNVAVVSSNGMEVDLHLGQAYQVLIYGAREDGLVCLLGARPVPEPGSGSSRWQELAAALPDCFAILAGSAGASPRRILAGQGITVIITAGEIEGMVDLLYGGGKKKKCS